MSNNKRMSWQNLSDESRKHIYHSLKGCIVGYRWYYSQLYSVADADIKRMKLRLICSNLRRSFRCLILIETIHGTRLGINGKQQRLRWRQSLISARAEKIAADTGVKFDEVYPELMRRMNPYLD
jgi:hypothetical protein